MTWLKAQTREVHAAKLTDQYSRVPPHLGHAFSFGNPIGSNFGSPLGFLAFS